ncbi:MAG TPA: hypothetical protein VGA73_05015 [Candidatus Binatia bacterium]
MDILLHLTPEWHACLLAHLPAGTKAAACIKAAAKISFKAPAPKTAFVATCDEETGLELLAVATVHCPEAAGEIATSMMFSVPNR